MKLEHLTDCEQLVMKTVWDAAEELSLMEIVQRVNDRYSKEWKSQTVSTFLTRLVRKGYLRNYRQGRVFLYQVLVPMEEYRAQLTIDYLKFWYPGNEDKFPVFRCERNLQEYPVGSTVRLSCDDNDDGPREVIGYKKISGSTYLLFKDGSEALIDKVINHELMKGEKSHAKSDR